MKISWRWRWKAVKVQLTIRKHYKMRRKSMAELQWLLSPQPYLRLKPLLHGFSNDLNNWNSRRYTEKPWTGLQRVSSTLSSLSYQAGLPIQSLSFRMFLKQQQQQLKPEVSRTHHYKHFFCSKKWAKCTSAYRVHKGWKSCPPLQ